MDALSPPPVLAPRLRVSRYPTSNYQSSFATGPSRTVLEQSDLDSALDHAADDNEGFDFPAASPAAGTAGTHSSSPAKQLRDLLRMIPPEESPVKRHDDTEPSELESDFESAIFSQASEARQSIMEVFRRAMQETPEKPLRRRRSSVDGSESELGTRTAKAQGKRQSLSDDEVGHVQDPSFRSEIGLDPSTFMVRNSRMQQSEAMDETSLAGQESGHDTSADTAIILHTLNNTRPTPAAASAQSSLQVSMNVLINSKSNLLGNDSGMDRLMNESDSSDPRTHVPFPSNEGKAASSPRQDSGLREVSDSSSFKTPAASDTVRGKEHFRNRPRASLSMTTPSPKQQHKGGPVTLKKNGGVALTSDALSRHLSSQSKRTDAQDDNFHSNASAQSSKVSDHSSSLMSVSTNSMSMSPSPHKTRPRSMYASPSIVVSPSDRVRTSSTPARPGSSTGISQPARHRVPSISIRSNSPTSSFGSAREEGQQRQFELQHEVAHERERNWNAPRPLWHVRVSSFGESSSRAASPLLSPQPSTSQQPIPRSEVPPSPLPTRIRALSLRSPASMEPLIPNTQTRPRPLSYHTSMPASGTHSTPVSGVSLGSSRVSQRLTNPTPSSKHSLISSSAVSAQKSLRNQQPRSIKSFINSHPVVHEGTQESPFPAASSSSSKLAPLRSESSTVARAPPQDRPVTPQSRLAPSLVPSVSRLRSHIPIRSPKKSRSEAPSRRLQPGSPEPQAPTSLKSALAAFSSTANNSRTRTDSLPETEEEDNTSNPSEEATPTLKTVLPPHADAPESCVGDFPQVKAKPETSSPPHRSIDEARLQSLVSPSQVQAPLPSVDVSQISEFPSVSPSIATIAQVEEQEASTSGLSPPRSSQAQMRSSFALKDAFNPADMPDVAASSFSDTNDDHHTTGVLQTPLSGTLAGKSSILPTPRPPGAWMATPMPRQRVRSNSLPNNMSSQDEGDSGHMQQTPAPASLSRATSLPFRTPAPPGSWVNTPAVPKGILKVRFNTPTSATDSDLSHSASGVTTTPNLDQNVGNDSRDSAPVRRFRSPGQIRVRVIDDFGNPIDDEPTTPDSRERKRQRGTPRNRSAVRIVDEMGHEIKEEDEESQLETTPDVALAKSTVIKAIPDEPSQEQGAAKYEGGALGAISQMLVEINRNMAHLDDEEIKRIQHLQQSSDVIKHIPPRTSSSKAIQIPQLDRRESWSYASSRWSISWSRMAVFLFLQLFALFSWYRAISWVQKDNISLNFYEPRHPDLYMHLEKSAIRATLSQRYYDLLTYGVEDGWISFFLCLWQRFVIISHQLLAFVWDTLNTETTPLWPPS